MAGFLHFLYMERVTIFLACNPFILLGLAWFALRPRSARLSRIYGDAKYRTLARQVPLSIAKTRGKFR